MVFDVAVIAVQYRHHQDIVPAEPRLFAEDIFRCFQDGAAGLWEYKLIHFLSGKLFLSPLYIRDTLQNNPMFATLLVTLE